MILVVTEFRGHSWGKSADVVERIKGSAASAIYEVGEATSIDAFVSVIVTSHDDICAPLIERPLH
jgi:hypothetical protein